MTPSAREWIVCTRDHGRVRVLGRPHHLVGPVLEHCGDGVSLSRAADLSVSDTIDLAKRMKQRKECN